MIQFSQIGWILAKRCPSKIVLQIQRALRPFFFFKIQKVKALKKQVSYFFQFPCIHYCFPTVSWLSYMIVVSQVVPSSASPLCFNELCCILVEMHPLYKLRHSSCTFLFSNSLLMRHYWLPSHSYYVDS